MKPDIHPEYRPVVFQDQSSGDNIIVGSTMETSDTITLDGVEYPLAKVELSSRSHPFFTGTMKIVDTAGRVERFERRYGSRRKKSAVSAEQAANAEPKTGAARKAAERQALPKKAAAKSKAEKVPAKKAAAKKVVAEKVVAEKVVAEKAVDDKAEVPEEATDSEPIEATEESGES